MNAKTMREASLLTQEEVGRLPDGAIVWVRWSGGNGPWRYRVRHVGDRAFAYFVDEDVFVGVLDCVGRHPLTEVSKDITVEREQSPQIL